MWRGSRGGALGGGRIVHEMHVAELSVRVCDMQCIFHLVGGLKYASYPVVGMYTAHSSATSSLVGKGTILKSEKLLVVRLGSSRGDCAPQRLPHIVKREVGLQVQTTSVVGKGQESITYRYLIHPTSRKATRQQNGLCRCGAHCASVSCHTER